VTDGKSETTETEVSGFDSPGAEFEYEERTGLTIILPTGGKAWLCWTETKDLAGWLVDLILKDSQ
jgi:hypothetical protein